MLFCMHERPPVVNCACASSVDRQHYSKSVYSNIHLDGVRYPLSFVCCRGPQDFLSRRNRDVLGAPPLFSSLEQVIEEPEDTGLTDEPLRLAAGPLWLLCSTVLFPCVSTSSSSLVSGWAAPWERHEEMPEDGLLQSLDAESSPRRNLLGFWCSSELGVRCLLFIPVDSGHGWASSFSLLFNSGNLIVVFTSSRTQATKSSPNKHSRDTDRGRLSLVVPFSMESDLDSWSSLRGRAWVFACLALKDQN